MLPNSKFPNSVDHLRLVVESADSCRTGGQVYVVARFSPEYEVLGVYSARDQAEAAVRSSGATGMEIYGPFETSNDEVGPTRRLTGITLTLSDVPEPIHINPADPSQGDTLVWSVSAFDKFMAPYYRRLYPADRVEAMRNEIRTTGFRIHIFSIGIDELR